MNDMLIFSNNDSMIKSTKKILTNKFDMKDIGVTDIISAIKISKTSNWLVLFQYYYVEKILKKFSKDDNSTIKIPIDISVYLSKNIGKRINQLEYSWII
jgi:hypothetical protein